jgi:hypothetical protein
VTVPFRGDLGASSGDNREVATALAAIVSRLDAQQTQLNAIQNRVLLADLSRTGTAVQVAAGAEAIEPPPVHVFQPGMEAIAPSLPREAPTMVSSDGGTQAGAIAPPAVLSGSGTRREDSWTTDDVTLAELRRDPVISAQARQLTDSIEAKQGMYMSSKMLRRGWSLAKAANALHWYPPLGYTITCLVRGRRGTCPTKSWTYFSGSKGIALYLYIPKLMAMISHMKFVF